MWALTHALRQRSLGRRLPHVGVRRQAEVVVQAEQPQPPHAGRRCRRCCVCSLKLSCACGWQPTVVAVLIDVTSRALGKPVREDFLRDQHLGGRHVTSVGAR